MNAIEQQAQQSIEATGFRQVFERMHAATRRNAQVQRATRQARLDALAALVHDNAECFVTAISADFGHRSAHETRLLELFPSLESIRHTRSHFGAWMKPQRKSASIWFRPGRARIIPQPLGVVGVIVPWNYPLFLAVSPLAAALAAGNRVMIKMSEFTPRTGELLAELVAKYFAADDVAVVLGDATVGADFARLPFDHLLFTGSTKVGHDIMRMAADNLTPVTLELGGKSPAIEASLVKDLGTIYQQDLPEIARTLAESDATTEEDLADFLDVAQYASMMAPSYTIQGGTTAVFARVNEPVVLQRLTITSSDATAAGQSSYGVRIAGSGASVTLQRCTVRAGRGANGTAGGTGYAIEFGGAAIRGLSIEGRMTVCNMAIEGGARCGYVNPDETTFEYLKGRPYSPKGDAWETTVAKWRATASDADAVYDDVVNIRAEDVPPTVTWGTSPDQAISVTENVPTPESATTEPARISIQDALDYMKLPAGQPIKGTKVDVAFIGSCTNGRLSDFREVAKFIKGKKVNPSVKAIAVPGSQIVDAMARQEGLDVIFSEAGFEWRAAGCSMCLAMNPDKLVGDQLCASSSNRNFKGRQGSTTGRTVLMSPVMVAAAALTGSIADAREVFSIAG